MTETAEVCNYDDLISHLHIKSESSKLLIRILGSNETNLKGLIEDLLLKIDNQEKEKLKLLIENRHLKQRLSLNSQNSSIAPSNELYKSKKVNTKSERERTGKKPGGQKARKDSTLNHAGNPDCYSLPFCIYLYQVWGKTPRETSKSNQETGFFDILDPVK